MRSLIPKRRSIVVVACVAALSVAVLMAQAATALRTNINHALVMTYTGTNDFGSPSFQLDAGNQAALLLGNGTASGQANALFADQRTIGASSSENLDLAGVLVDPLGATLTFTTIKAIKIKAADANTNNVLVGGAASNTFVGPFSDATDIVAVKPGGIFMWVAPQTGATVTASTGDILKIANSGGTTGVTYDIFIIGTQ